MLGHRRVFVDPALAAETHLVRLIHHAPVAYPENPLVFDSDFCDREKLDPDAARESADQDQHEYLATNRIVEGMHRWFNPSVFGRGGQVMSVVRSPLTGRLQMYYLVVGNLNLVSAGLTGGSYPTCYAESEDGINWHMPVLNKFRVWGNTENNIMFAPPSAAYVRIDPHAPDPNRRYIAFVHHGPRIYTSPDGINWSRPIAAKLETKIGRSDGDTFVGWAPNLGKYVALFRPWHEYEGEPEGRQLMRRIGWAVSDDLEHWYDHRCVLSADEKDGPTSQLERLLCFPYQDFYLGLAHVMQNFAEERRTYSFMMGTIHLELCFSPDTRQWQRYDERFPFISVEPGLKNHGMILSADAPVEVGDDLLFYYTSASRIHGHLPVDDHLCVAKLPKDRFIGLRADNEPGYVLTAPFACPGGRLRINADLGNGGHLRVGIILPDGRHSLEHAVYRCNYAYGPQPVHEIRWQRVDHLEMLKGQQVQLKLYIRNGELFSFWFE